MPRFLGVIALAALLAGCAGGPASPAPTAAPIAAPAPSTLAPTAPAAPTAAPPTETPPTAAPVPAATARPAPTAPPADPPTAAPTAEAPAPPPAGADPPSISSPLDVAAQAAALLPEYRADLDRAGAWNRYTIVASLDPQSRTLAGAQQVEYTNRDSGPLDRIYFHLYPNLEEFGGRLEVTELSVDGTPVPVSYEAGRYLLPVALPRPIAPGEQAVVSMQFTTRAPANASESNYGAFNRENGALALASSYPIAAIVRGGAWDIGRPDSRGDFVNSETALYDVTLTAPADWTLAATGVVADGRLDGGQQTARFVSGPQRDFMITALQYRSVSAEVDGTTVTSYYRPGSETGGQGALQAAVRALAAFNERYGRYPLRELDVVEIDARTFLGVEYPGIILIEHGLYGNQQALEVTVAHEVAHQWWYSLVGNDVQTDAWLDEAMASYSQIVYQEEVYGPEAAEFELDGFRNRYRQVVAAGRDGPVSQPNSSFSRNYVQLVYGKAVLFVQALREQIGDESFGRFLQAYYDQSRYGFVDDAQFLGTAEAACTCELDDLYRSWIVEVAPVEIP